MRLTRVERNRPPPCPRSRAEQHRSRQSPASCRRLPSSGTAAWCRVSERREAALVTWSDDEGAKARRVPSRQCRHRRQAKRSNAFRRTYFESPRPGEAMAAGQHGYAPEIPSAPAAVWSLTRGPWLRFRCRARRTYAAGRRCVRVRPREPGRLRESVLSTRPFAGLRLSRRSRVSGRRGFQSS
jgi:hypothetical protein